LTVIDSNEIAGELAQRFGTPVQTFVDGLTHLFPRPEDLTHAHLAAFGVPEETAIVINTLSAAVCKKHFVFDTARNLQDTISSLKAIGFGDEMSHYVAMRAFSEPDAFPLDDREVRNWLKEGDKTASEDDALNMAEAWRPWRAYAAMHLWAAKAAL
jgi:3-methyladenine DNA glycosylase/8-oxoguanine DNA glycosylase